MISSSILYHTDDSYLTFKFHEQKYIWDVFESEVRCRTYIYNFEFMKLLKDMLSMKQGWSCS